MFALVVFGLFDFLGIGRGRVDIVLEKKEYAMGEPVRGKLVLKLNKPVAAKELRVELESIESRSTRVHTRKGWRNKSHIITEIRASARLDGEKEYPVGEKEYPFELVGPKEYWNEFGGVRWSVNASLDIPGGFDVQRSVPIKME